MKRKDFYPNWRNIDAQYNWVGVDFDGKIYAFMQKPYITQDKSTWYDQSGEYILLGKTTHPESADQFLYERPKDKYQTTTFGEINGWLKSNEEKPNEEPVQSNWIDYAEEFPPFDEGVLFCGDNYKEAIIASLIESIQTSKGKYIVVQFEDGARSKYNMDNEKTYWQPLPQKA